jgi:phage shock protein A
MYVQERSKMSILSRFKAIFQARANQVADQFEDPKAGLDYSLVRLEESHSQIKRSLIDVSAAKNRLENQRNQINAAVQNYEEQAQAAVRAAREDLARTALERKQEAETRKSELENNIASLERQVETLKGSQANLERKIAIFRSKKAELKAIYDSSRAQLRVREALSGISKDLADVSNTVQRAEERIREMQSRSDAIEGLIAKGILSDALEPDRDDIDRELSRIGRDQAVEKELARLKLDVAK